MRFDTAGLAGSSPRLAGSLPLSTRFVKEWRVLRQTGGFAERNGEGAEADQLAVRRTSIVR